MSNSDAWLRLLLEFDRISDVGKLRCTSKDIRKVMDHSCHEREAVFLSRSILQLQPIPIRPVHMIRFVTKEHHAAIDELLRR